MRYIFLLILIFFMTACTNNSTNGIEEKIYSLIKKQNYKDTFNISLSNIIDTTWQQLYIFKPGCSSDTIEKILKQKYPHSTDLVTCYVFVDTMNNIVYHTEVAHDFETGSLITFSEHNNRYYEVFFNKEFIVSSVKYDSVRYFILNQEK